MANNPYDLAKLMADVSSSPKVYVVPDEQLNQQQLQQPIPRSQIRYGEEVPRQSWQQTTAALVDAIGRHRKANPVTIPFPAGTKTLAAKKFEEEKRRFDMEWPYQEQSYQYSLNKPYYSPNNSNTGGMTKNESLNQLSQSIYNLKEQGYTREEVEGTIYSNAGDLGSNISTKDVQGLLDQIYGTTDGSADDILNTINKQLNDSETSGGMSADEAMKQALKERPWWQKLLDVLPGKQYR